MLMADVGIINKVDSATPEQIEQVRRNVSRFNPSADLVLAESAVTSDHPEQVSGKRVLVVEDGPTLTHGEMRYGAGLIAAHRWGAAQVAWPKSCAVGSMQETLEQYPHIDQVIPAMGYSPQQIKDLEATINQCDCDLVLFATPIDLPKLVQINKPHLRIRYEYQDHGAPTLEEILHKRLKGVSSKPP
jgi:predicted GTPase